MPKHALARTEQQSRKAFEQQPTIANRLPDAAHHIKTRTTGAQYAHVVVKTADRNHK